MDALRKDPAHDLHEAHRQMLADLRDLEEQIGPAATLAPWDVSARLSILRSRLHEQFRFEEEDGYAHEVLARAPQLGRKVVKLLDDHAALAQSLEALVEQARVAESLDDSLRHQLRSWIHRWRQHESEENIIFEDAFNVECCAAD
jgi:hypothetical protein